MGWLCCCCYVWVTKHGLSLLLLCVGHQTWVEFVVVMCGSPNMGWVCCCYLWVTKHGLSLLLFYVGHQTWVEVVDVMCGSPNMGWVCCCCMWVTKHGLSLLLVLFLASSRETFLRVFWLVFPSPQNPNFSDCSARRRAISWICYH